MSISVKLLKKINAFFPLPVHPFNLKGCGTSYARWQFERGRDTIKFYLEKVTPEEMFRGKTVLDIGCGGGGKTVYYATLGVKKIYGLDILPKYKFESESLAKEMGVSRLFEFVCCDAAKTGFEDNFFDTIIMNDAMEHVSDPEAVINECRRILKPGGRLYINFPPYKHPYGAHLSDAIGIPWVHCFFNEKTLIKAYKDLVRDLPDGQERIDFRISECPGGEEYLSYINKMSIKRFRRITEGSDFKLHYWREVPLRRALTPLAKLPGLKEYFVKMAVCILEK